MIPLFFDWETSYKYNLPWIKGAYPVSLCIKIGSEMETFIFNHTDRDYTPANLKKIQEYFARADILVAHNCFKGDTQYLTKSGIVSFKDTVNTKQYIWSEGQWREGFIKRYGKDFLTKLVLVPYNRSRTSIEHIIETTSNHRWAVDRVYITNKFGRQRLPSKTPLTTSELKVGDKIWGSLPTYSIDVHSDAFRHGLIFADGAKCSDREAYQIRLCGWKECFKTSFNNYTYPPSAKGDPVVNYYKSSINLKQTPTTSEGEYIANFIEGWRLLDGTEKKNNTIVITTTDEEAANWLFNNSALGGWFCTGISKHYMKESSFSQENSPYWMITLTKDADMGWTVKEIHRDISYEDVYCVEVPSTGTFTLAQGIHTFNCKFDLHWLRAIGVDFSDKRIYCTMVTEYLLNSQRIGDLSLHDMSIRYELPSKIDLVKEWWDSGYETDEIPLSILVPYGEQDVLNCEAIYYKQIPQIKAQGKGQLVKLRCESLKITQEIEWNGMHLDTTLAQELSEEYGARMKEIEDAIQICIEEALPEIKDIPYKMTSGDHLSAILFGGVIKYDGKETVTKVLKGGQEKEYERKAKLCISTLGLGFKPASGTETAKQGYYKTDVGQLSMLKPETEAQRLFLSLTQELAKLEKMKGTYCDGLLAVHIDGIVHPTMNECVTKTGRYSSKNPKHNWGFKTR